MNRARAGFPFRRSWFALCGTILAVLALDLIFFRLLVWTVPNETAWDTAPLYSYEHRLRELERSPAGVSRVVVVGSSIAQYAVLPEVLAAAIADAPNRAGALRASHSAAAGAREFDPSPKVSILAFQGQHPLHLRVGVRRLIALRPDLVILPVGFVDFRPERPLVLGLADDLRDPERRAAARRLLRQDLVRDHRLRLIAPAVWLREYGADLDREAYAAGLFATLFASYRYRGVLGEPLRGLFANRFSRGRHYHHYAGLPVGGGNVFHRGWTGTEFRLRWNEVLATDGLWLEAPPELIAAAQAGPSRLTVAFAGTRRTLPLASGWQRIDLPSARVGDEIEFEVEPGWESPLLDGRLGVRLAARAGRVRFERRGREVRREDLLYPAYTEGEYRRSFERRMRRFDRAGMEYLQSLEQARRYWAARAFDPGLPACEALDAWARELRRAGVPVLLVIAPENPLSVALYGDSAWYGGFRDFLRGLPVRGLVDARDWLRMQDFYDHHHPGYFGAQEFSRRLGRRIATEAGGAARTAGGPAAGP